MQKVFAKKLKDTTFSFYDDDIYHLTKVLRVKLNDEIICIYEQNKYLCKIISLSPFLAEIKDKINTLEQEYTIDLFQAVIKPKSFELIFKKAIEMNTNSFYPVTFSRSQTNLIKELRLNTLSKVCSSQANRDNLMNVYEPLNFNELIKTLNNMNYDLIIVPYEKETINYLYQSDFQNETKKIALIVGPEGGFTNDEIIQLQNFKNLKLISLTKTILRSETASLYALSIINNFLLCKGKK